MRRWLAILLVVFLPLQVSWAAVADYCSHEHGKAAQHFGHHDDEHEAGIGASDDNPQPAGKSGLGHDHSHLSGFLGLLSEPALSNLSALPPLLSSDEPGYSFLPPEEPERPNWSFPA
jgi:hypothetical protein